MCVCVCVCVCVCLFVFDLSKFVFFYGKKLLWPFIAQLVRLYVCETYLENVVVLQLFA